MIVSSSLSRYSSNLKQDITKHFVSHFLNTQVDPAKYKGIFNGFKVTLNEEGVRALAKGWAPTAIGYSMQGLCKFGFYEVFKILYSNLLGEVRIAYKMQHAFMQCIQVNKLFVYAPPPEKG